MLANNKSQRSLCISQKHSHNGQRFVARRLPGDPAPASQQEEVFLAFGRVFSGVARAGGRVHVLSSAYDPSSPQRQRQTAVLKGLFLMMGRALERLDAVPAGNVLAIFGLETAILKSATLASSPACRPLAPMTFQARRSRWSSCRVVASRNPVIPPAQLSHCTAHNAI